MAVEQEPDRQAWKSALARVVKRAERNDQKLLDDTFVELADLSMRMSSDENQILFGRRGTGKSHAFCHLRDSVRNDGTLGVLIDLRTVGSAGGYYLSSTGGRALAGLHIVVDLLGAIHGEVLELSLQLMEDRDVTKLVGAMDRFAEAVSDVTVDGPASRSRETSRSDGSTGSFSVGLSPHPTLSTSASREESETRSQSYSVQGLERPALNFGQVAKALCELVAELPGSRMWLLLDEWSALPLDVQPVVADFLRRCMLPCRGLVVKIAAVERRSRFWAMGDSGYVGLELGSDIGTGLDLDELLTRGLKASPVNLDFYRQLVVKHARAVAREQTRPQATGRLESDYMLTNVFPAFADAVYFSAGVPRDLLSISGLAASRSPALSNIEFADVAAASRQFFLQEKEAQARVVRSTRVLSSALREYSESGCLRFLVDRDYSHRNEDLLELLDQRVIHLLDHAIGPRGKFDLFAIDLGMVADLLSEMRCLSSGWNPWLNWAHVKTSQKIAPILRIRNHHIDWEPIE